MKYTLDSLQQVKTALKNISPGFDITDNQVILSGNQMTNMVTENELKAYFGTITAGDDTFIELYWRGHKVLTIDSGSQIILAFTQLKFVDELGVEVQPEGQFRGSEIQILP